MSKREPIQSGEPGQSDEPAAKSPTTGHLRSLLMGGLERAAQGQMNYKDGQLMIGFANQAIHSLTAETRQREQMIRLGSTAEQLGRLGELDLCG